MRIWDIEAQRLCRQHLLGEHRELHAIWNILTLNKRGYANHPETKRWENKLAALYNRHTLLVKEIIRRGYRHNSDLDKALATGSPNQDTLINAVIEQELILTGKDCPCLLTLSNNSNKI